ncbi:MAG: hypothetical protein GY944_22385 [bacterium]|nr:hypothetical protein [bacterium]
MQKIFVGDVQGCGDEFQQLVERAERTFGGDYELWCVGDLINRGPKNLLPLRLMRELVDDGRGVFILGNHELGLLRVWLGIWELEPKNTYSEVLGSDECEMWIDWLRRQPLARCGVIGNSRFAMVHAAAHPEWTVDDIESSARRIEARLVSDDVVDLQALLGEDDTSADAALLQDRDVLGRLTRCRSVDANGVWSSAPPRKPTRPWHQAWSERPHDYGMIYGHWSQQGLHVAPGLRGLDTGCVHHGRGREGFLTAWLPRDEDQGVFAEDQFAVPDDRFWRIDARRSYYL